MSDCIILTGGGTGGHLYPGFAVAQEIKKRSPETECFFVGSTRGIENKVLPTSDYPHKLMNIGPLNGVSKFQLLKTLLQLPFSIWSAKKLLKQKKPKAVIGFGGYASGPVLLACLLTKTPFFMWEGNAMPGLVTRKIGKYAQRVFLALEAGKKRFSGMETEVVGVPTRFEGQSSEAQAKPHQPLRVFIFGGSQGSKAINEMIWELMDSPFGEKLDEAFEIYHQVGKTGVSQLANVSADKEYYQGREFVQDMKSRYEWADIVICRTGASSISELTQMGLPGIFIPLPTSADDHQRKNAKFLEENFAGIYMEQGKEKSDVLYQNLLKFSDPDFYARCAKASAGAAKFGAAEKIVDFLL
ncbi:MAG: undecaprenyldiphospho-muramoylpentapeptide beta-N-acetylglucosaminyltransferase [Bdellovibrionota bacterium]|nr:undecaprenyldiphospho-muramoylpentapeptide beta-N-acetylglucosaminyltransferase [Bdellovibrionota bacterium]